MSTADTPPIEKAAGVPLRWLTKFSGSDVAIRLGLNQPAQWLLYRGAKQSMRAAAKAADVFADGKKNKNSKDKKLVEAARLEKPKKPSLFDLTPTEDQQMVRDTMRRFADDVLRKAAEAADEAATAPAEILQQSHELGITLMAIPDELGGAAEERSPLSNALIIEELARGDMGLALAILAPHAVATALVDWGTAEQQATYLPAFADDNFVPAAMALLEPAPMSDPSRPQTGAVRADDGGWLIHGEKSMVPLGETARLFLVGANILGAGPRLFLVERETEGLTVTADPTMGLRSAGLCKLTFDGVKVSADALIGEPGREGFDFNAVVERARVAWCAMAVGGCQAVLEYVAEYVNDRQAFGEPISNRQSVAFLVADIALELEGMRLLMYQAASRAEKGKDIKRESFLARMLCASKAMQIGTNGVQLLGGHGFVKDHPVERWYRHLRGVGIYEGGLLI